MNNDIFFVENKNKLNSIIRQYNKPQTRKTQRYIGRDGNIGSVLGQAHTCGGVKQVNRIHRRNLITIMSRLVVL